jgi:16S rRNA processing protein RimM
MECLAATERFLAIARIVRPQGRRGEVAAEVLTDFPSRFSALRTAFLEEPGGEPDPVTVESAWLHKGRVILKFAGVDSIDDASRLRGWHVLLPRAERVALPDHHYYLWELQGCRVVRQLDGVAVEIGVVTEVQPTEGVSLLHVSPTRKLKGTEERDGGASTTGTPEDEILIPLAQAICKRIDTGAKVIVIDPPEDLLELNER